MERNPFTPQVVVLMDRLHKLCLWHSCSWQIHMHESYSAWSVHIMSAAPSEERFIDDTNDLEWALEEACLHLSSLKGTPKNLTSENSGGQHGHQPHQSP